MTEAPDRSLEQRREALRRANKIRRYRASLKEELAAGGVKFTDVLADPHQYVETARVLDFLMAVPKIGKVKANRTLTQCRISPSKTIGGLSERQRAELIAYLRSHHERYRIAGRID